MKYKTTWYPVDGSDPTEVVYDSLPEVATAINDNPQWESESRGFYIDWISDDE